MTKQNWLARRSSALVRIIGLGVGAGLLLAGSARGQVESTANKAAVSLHASVQAVAPASPFDLAIRFDLAKDWHIYWSNPGQSGLPPQVQWTLPDGFTVGDLQFPVPKKHKTANLTTYILERQPVLLARVTPPATPPSGSVRISAEIDYLVCKKQCLREQASVSIELPVLSDGGAQAPANTELFDSARRRLPKAKAKWLQLRLEAKTGTFKPGDKFDLELHIKIKSGLHIQSNTPLQPGLIAADVLMERTPGFYIENPVYPEPHLRTDRILGKLSEFQGDVVIRIPAEVTDVATGSVRFAGILTYQACTNKGQCYPPETVAFSTIVNPLRGADAGSATDKSATVMAQAEPAAPVEPAETTVSDRENASGEPTDGDAAGETREADAATPPIDPASIEDTNKGVYEEEEVGGGFEAFLRGLGLPGLLFGCFLYGLMINATPCVLPILSIKVMGFVQQARQSRRRTLGLGLSFGAGVIIFFVVLGFLAAAGKNVLQIPAAVIVLGAVVMALSLSMLGVYTLQAPMSASKLEAAIQKEGMLSSFGKGALAPVLGFACTGPLMAGAFAWATQQEPKIAVLAFLCAGLGMASPYILLGANPNWLSFLPKPGNWMITFERIMGFLLLGMVLWLLHPLGYHIGTLGLEWTMAFLVVVAMACWVLGQITLTMSSAQRWKYRSGAGAMVAVSALLIFGVIFPLGEARAEQRSLRAALASAASGTPVGKPGTAVENGSLAAPQPASDDPPATAPSNDPWSAGIPWRPWSREAVDDAVRAGRTVFVDFTAAYCTTCKQNKAVATNTKDVRTKMQKLGVVPFSADFTDGDPEIFAELKKYGRLGPPLNLIYPAGKPDKPIVLKILFNKAYLLAKLDEAGPSTSTGGS